MTISFGRRAGPGRAGLGVWRALVVAAALALAACVPTSEHPIAGPAPTPDLALIGGWHGTPDEGGRIDMHFLRRPDGQIAAVLITTEKDELNHDQWAVFTLVTAEVKGTHYMSALWDYDDGTLKTGRDHGYHLLRYEIGADGSLALFAVNEKKLIRAVERHRLQGVIDDSNKSYKEVRVTAPSDKLVAYLEEIDPKALFDQPFARMTRNEPK